MSRTPFPSTIKGIALMLIAGLFGRKDKIEPGKKITSYKFGDDVPLERQVANIMGFTAVRDFLDTLGAPSFATKIQFARDIAAGIIDPLVLAKTDSRWANAVLNYGNRYGEISAVRQVVTGQHQVSLANFQLVGYRQIMALEAQKRGVDVKEVDYKSVDPKLTGDIVNRLKESMGNYAALLEAHGEEMIERNA